MLYRHYEIDHCYLHLFSVNESHYSSLDMHPYCMQVREGMLWTDCTRNRKAVAFCNLVKYSRPIPSEYQVNKSMYCPCVTCHVVNKYMYCPYYPGNLYKEFHIYCIGIDFMGCNFVIFLFQTQLQALKFAGLIP
jgi:hypothetical protein